MRGSTKHSARRPLMLAAGLKLDEKISRADFTRLFDEMRQRFQPGPRGTKKEEKK